MMNCKEFRHWLGENAFEGEHPPDEIGHHLAVCEACQKLHDIDLHMETRLREGLEQVDPPPGLLAGIELDTQSRSSRRLLPSWTWRKLAPALAMAAVLVMVVLNPFSGKIESLDAIGSYALAAHQDADLDIVFKAQEIQDVAAWFFERVGFRITLPDFKNLNVAFVGGRPCYLGKKKVAYLFCEKDGQKVSLFVISPQALKFSIPAKRSYQVHDPGHQIKVWEEGGMVFALVEGPA